MALWKERKYQPVISPTLFEQLVDVLNRPEISTRIEPQRKLALFRRIRSDAFWTPGALDTSGSMPDPEDDFLLAAAFEADSGWIVTWDKQLLEADRIMGIQIVNPDQFISFLIRNK